jgi:VCBS repeat-containing protein
VVNAVNDQPVAANDGYVTSQSTVLNVAAPGVLANDGDVDSSTLTAVLVTGPSHGILTLNANGSFTYTPAATYFGPDSFTYKTSDGLASSNVATVTITVNQTLYAFVAVQNLPPPLGKTFNAGSSVPLRWQWLLNGSGAASVSAQPQIAVTGPGGTQVFTVQDAGKSSFQPPTAANNYTWQFNWQSVDALGRALPKGTYNITVKSLQTGQSNGPFAVVLK